VFQQDNGKIVKPYHSSVVANMDSVAFLASPVPGNYIANKPTYALLQALSEKLPAVS
jgi:hypothetical protein